MSKELFSLKTLQVHLQFGERNVRRKEERRFIKTKSNFAR